MLTTAAAVEEKKRQLAEAERELASVNDAIAHLQAQAGDPDFDPSDLTTESGRKAVLEQSIDALKRQIAGAGLVDPPG